jgi:Tetratricopeptide repeat
MSRLTLSLARSALALALLPALVAPARAAGPSVSAAKGLIKDGRCAEAEAMLKELLAGKPGDTSTLYWLAQAAIGAEDYAEAEAALRQVTAARPDSADAHYWLGVTLERSGKTNDAVASYRRSAALSGHKGPAAEALKRFTPAKPPGEDPGHRAVALQVEGGLSVDREQIKVASPHIYDYTFTSAPTDWVTETGDWRVRSRWSCTPDWNFMGGESAEAATIWSKREFVGDITVEAYISNKMNVLGEGGYRNATDFNITLCGDGRNLSSGYSFIVGGWGDSYTRILKGTRVLAETNDPAFRPVTLLDGQPGTWSWHRRWWEARAVRRGRMLYLFFDNRLALQAEDPDPLAGGRVALWTFDNGILIPRVKIYYEAERSQAERSTPVYVSEPAPAEPPAAPLVTFTSATHPSIQCRFDHDLDGWAQRDGEQGALLSLDGETPDGGGRCLRLVNQNAGGTFGATASVGTFDAVRLNRLQFDYRAPDALKANIQLTAAGARYEIIFTAPEYPSDSARRLSVIPDVKTDLKWHHVDLDLLAALRRFLPDPASIEVSDVWFGIDTTRDYIQAGFGGNPALCEYWIDNFALIGAGPADGQVQLGLPQATGAAPAPTASYDFVIDGPPHAEPDGTPDSTDGVVTLAALADGVHYLHARAILPDGTQGPVCDSEIVVDASPPTVGSVSPAPDTRAGSEVATVEVRDAGAGVNPSSLAVAVSGRELTLASPGVSYDPAAGALAVDLGRAGFWFDAGQSVEMALVKAADWRGNALAEPQAWRFTYDPKLDTEAPAPPAVAAARGYLCQDTFEDGFGSWQPYATSIPAEITRDNSTAASGQWSLRVYNPRSSGAMGAVARPEPFDAGVYRVVSFDYKLRPEVRIDLYAVVNGTGYSVQLSNNDGANKIGAFADVKADDQWHHAEANLYELLRQAIPTSPGYIVSTLMLLDAGNYGNVQHQYYNIDNFTIAPVLAAPQGVTLKLACADASGIAGLSYLVDASPATEPPAEIGTRVEDVVLPQTPEGEAWLHARAVDRAGNWSAPTHHRLLADAAPPTAQGVSPTNAAATAVSQVVLNLADTGIAGIDPRSVRLEVGGTTYTVDNAGLVFNSTSGQLVWNCENVAPSPVVFANGQAVPVRLLAAADYAGNPVSSLPTWTWTMDYSQDTTPPAIASLSCSTHSTYLMQTFEEGTQHIQRYGDGSSAQIALDPASPTGAGQSVKVTQGTAGGNMAVYLVAGSFSTASYPYLSFDYRIPPGTTVDLFVYFYSEVLVVQMTDSAGGYSDTIPIQADGQWHHCTYNLHSLISTRAAQRGLGAYYTVSYVGLYHRSGNLAAGADLNLDNVVVCAAGPNAATFSWSATDTTGIVGYSYAVDQAATTVPAETSVGTATSATFPNLPAGISYLHVRALDGAGHWGPTRHWAILVQ